MIVEQNSNIDDLRRVDGKAEIVGGRIKCMSPTGGKPARAGGKIYASLLQYEEQHGGGYALPDNAGFLVDLPDRESFSPDAAWYTGPTVDMSFVVGAPAFAVEFRSEADYDAQAERDIAAKIADYFAAGTLVVWDVDLLGSDVIRKYTAVRPTEPVIFRTGDIADAEPAAPQWRLRVDGLVK
jgi:Uma2 family endonuclease